MSQSVEIHPCNEATPLIRTLRLVRRVAGLEGVFLINAHHYLFSQAEHQASSGIAGGLDSGHGQREATLQVHPLQVCVWVRGGGHFFLPCLPLSARHPGPPHGLLPHTLQLTKVSGT